MTPHHQSPIDARMRVRLRDGEIEMPVFSQISENIWQAARRTASRCRGASLTWSTSLESCPTARPTY